MGEAKQPYLDSKGRPIERRVSSADIESQGAGTWVEFRRNLRLKHLRAIAEMATFSTVDWGTDSQGALDAFSRIGAVLSQVVIAWNWTDDEGEPLEQPKKNPDVFEELTFPELTWLIAQLGKNVGVGNPKAPQP